MIIIIIIMIYHRHHDPHKIVDVFSQDPAARPTAEQVSHELEAAGLLAAP